MASSTCQVFGGTKRVRLERIVRRRYVNGLLEVAVFQTRLQDLWIVHGVCHMGTTTADVFSLTLYLTARSKRVHVRKHKRLCAMAVFALNLSPERLLNCSVLVRRKLSMRNLDRKSTRLNSSN